MGRGANTEPKAESVTRRTGDLQKALQRISKLKAAELPTTEDFKLLCEYKDPRTGIEAKADKVEYVGREQMLAEGHLWSDGQKVGEFQRWCRRDGMQGKYLAVKPSWLKLDPSKQRQGFGQAFHQAFEARCQQAGVDRIEILADEQGAYAWASRGYQFFTFRPYPRVSMQYQLGPDDHELAERVYALDCAQKATGLVNKRQDRIRELIDAGLVAPELAEELQRQLLQPDETTEDFEANCALATTKIRTPALIASFGEDTAWVDQDGHPTWLGKEILLNNQWEGVKFF